MGVCTTERERVRERAGVVWSFLFSFSRSFPCRGRQHKLPLQGQHSQSVPMEAVPFSPKTVGVSFLAEVVQCIMMMHTFIPKPVL